MGIKVIKVILVGGVEDVVLVKFYGMVDMLLFDIKVKREIEFFGGWGEVFDWSFMDVYEGDRLWLFVGGLIVYIVKEVVEILGIKGVDVFFGVECFFGEKDLDFICCFLCVVNLLWWFNWELNCIFMVEFNFYCIGLDEDGNFGLYGGCFVVEILMFFILDFEFVYR